MSRIHSFLKLLQQDPMELVLRVLQQPRFPISDKNYLKIWYKHATGQRLELDCPKSYNDKLNWLKLYDRRPIYTTMVDKYAVKQYVADKIGAEYVIPLLGVWDKPEDIDFDSLPNEFVLKVTHGGGNSGVVICKDKEKFDKGMAIYKLSRCMRVDGSIGNKEWPYKNVKRRVIAEEYKEDSKTRELRDFKFFCFNGEPKILFVASGRGTQAEPNFDFFDMDYNRLDMKSAHPWSDPDKLPEKPTSFEDMKRIAAKLSQGLPHVRIDLYEVDGHVFFGEYTFFHWAGTGLFEPDRWNKTLGDWINLPKIVN